MRWFASRHALDSVVDYVYRVGRRGNVHGTGREIIKQKTIKMIATTFLVILLLYL